MTKSQLTASLNYSQVIKIQKTHQPENYSVQNIDQDSSYESQIKSTQYTQNFQSANQFIEQQNKKQTAEQKHLQNQNKYKNKKQLCRFFERGQLCKYGNGCKYAHGIQELRASFGTSQYYRFREKKLKQRGKELNTKDFCSELKKSDKYKIQLCNNFEENQSCIYGDKCKFAHGIKELRTRPQFYNKKYKSVPCKDFKKGYCKRGVRCCFKHSYKIKEQLSKFRYYQIQLYFVMQNESCFDNMQIHRNSNYHHDRLRCFKSLKYKKHHKRYQQESVNSSTENGFSTQQKTINTNHRKALKYQRSFNYKKKHQTLGKNVSKFQKSIQSYTQI